MHFNQAKHLHKKTYMTYMFKKPSDKNAPNMEVYPRLKRKSFLFFFKNKKSVAESGNMAGKVPKRVGADKTN
jgi:hypothetical protein